MVLSPSYTVRQAAYIFAIILLSIINPWYAYKRWRIKRCFRQLWQARWMEKYNARLRAHMLARTKWRPDMTEDQKRAFYQQWPGYGIDGSVR